MPGGNSNFFLGLGVALLIVGVLALVLLRRRQQSARGKRALTRASIQLGLTKLASSGKKGKVQTTASLSQTNPLRLVRGTAQQPRKHST